MNGSVITIQGLGKTKTNQTQTRQMARNNKKLKQNLMEQKQTNKTQRINNFKNQFFEKIDRNKNLTPNNQRKEMEYPNQQNQK